MCVGTDSFFFQSIVTNLLLVKLNCVWYVILSVGQILNCLQLNSNLLTPHHCIESIFQPRQFFPIIGCHEICLQFFVNHPQFIYLLLLFS
jgi:hypothetical protein